MQANDYARMKQLTEDQSTDPVRSNQDGAPAVDDFPQAVEPPEVRQAKDLARRYRLPFVNLLPQDGESPIDYSLLERNSRRSDGAQSVRAVAARERKAAHRDG